MNENIFNTVFLPLALFIIMLGMGLTLKLADFGRVFKFPKAVLVGLFNQLIVLPLTGFLIAWSFSLNPELAVGLMLVALCPGGATSNLITHLAKANLALSITLTAFSSIITVFTIPYFLGLSMDFFMGEAKAISIPFLPTILKIMAITILPVGIGMLVRGRYPRFAEGVIRLVNIISMIFFVLVVVVAVAQDTENLQTSFMLVGLPLLILNVLMFVIGFLIARLGTLDFRESLTVSIETGIQNGALAIAIALGILGNSTIALPGALYGLMMFFTVIPVVIFGRRFKV